MQNSVLKKGLVFGILLLFVIANIVSALNANHDGIGGTPYNIPGGINQDLYRLGYFHNIPPVALFTYTPLFPTDLDVIQFIDQSIDDENITSWNWEFGDGGASIIQNATHQYADDGNYLVTLTVTDDDGANDTVSQLVVVSNIAPVADADGPYYGTTDHAIHFNGSESNDPDGKIVSYDWDFGDDKPGAGENPIHKYDNYGIYTVMLFVVDDDGVTDIDTTTVLINKGTPPKVNLLYPDDGDIVNGTVNIIWYAFDAADGDDLLIYIYIKDIDDVLFSAFVGNPYFNSDICEWDTTVFADGVYELLVQAVDSEGNIGADICTFEIKNHEEPTENHSPEKPITPSGEVQGKPEIEYSYTTKTSDPDGDLVYYLWDWDDGNRSGWLGPYGSAVTAVATYKWAIKGSYRIKVKAKDIYGKESAWSDPLPITIPYIPTRPLLQFLEWLIERFPYSFSILGYLIRFN